jgi:CRP-like cAMP-binding protein
MEQRRQFLEQRARDLLEQLEVRRAPVEVSFASRSETAAELAAGSNVRLVVAAPRPGFLRGWSPADVRLQRRLRERLLWVDQPLSIVEGAPFPDTYRILREHALYARVPALNVRHAARGLDVARLDPHEVIIQQGEVNRAFWLILEGRVAVSINGNRERVVGRGGFVGGFSLLTGRPAAASVVTLTPVRALVASEQGFRLVAGHELVRLRLRTFYAERFASG